MSDPVPHPQPLNYLAPARQRSSWAIVVLCVYLTVIGACVVFVAIPILSAQEVPSALGLLGVLAVLGACEAGLLWIPVRKTRGRPLSRRSLWLPLMASGLLTGLLVLGGGMALAELAKSEHLVWAAVCVAPIAWAAWSIIFWTISRRPTGQGIGQRLHRFLLAGSVLELLVAVPTHVIVRRRSECCAGIMTGIGIGCGVAVMLLAFGPSVFFLYARRWRDIRPPMPFARPTLADDQ